MPTRGSRPGQGRRREMANRQRQAAATARDSVQRSALLLAAEVLDPDEDARDDSVLTPFVVEPHDDIDLGSAG